MNAKCRLLLYIHLLIRGIHSLEITLVPRFVFLAVLGRFVMLHKCVLIRNIAVELTKRLN